MDKAARDRKRLRQHKVAMDAIGLSLEEADKLGPAELEARVRGAVAEKSLERTAEQKALNLGETVSLGGRPVQIRPLSAQRAAEWRREVLAAQKIGREGFTRLDQITDPLEQAEALMEHEMLITDQKRELLESYLGDVIGESTDEEIGRALEVAQAIAFPLFSRALNAQIQSAVSSA